MGKGHMPRVKNIKIKGMKVGIMIIHIETQRDMYI